MDSPPLSAEEIADVKKARKSKGILYLLNNGIMFEKKGEGVKFEANFDYLASFEAVKKNKLLVVIRTSLGRKSVEFKFDSKIISANQVEYDITQTNEDYARDLPPGYKSTSDMKKTSDDPLISAKTGQKYDFLTEKEFVLHFGSITAKEYDELQEYAAKEKSYWPRLEKYIEEQKRRERSTLKESENAFFILVHDHDVRIPDIVDLVGYLKERYPQLTTEQLAYTKSGLQEINKNDIEKGYYTGLPMLLFERYLQLAIMTKWTDPFTKAIDVLREESLTMKPYEASKLV
jgi:hypothetical protein